MLILILGLPGTGKTTVARAFAAHSGATHLNSDASRRTLGLMGQYKPGDKEKVYASLIQQARESLFRGETVVIDSTFYKERIREPYRTLAMECKAPIYWVETQAGEHSIRERLSHPRPDSEADFEVYEKIRDQFEPLSEKRLLLNTDLETPESAAEKIHLYLQS